jgi:hypothetical protein
MERIPTVVGVEPDVKSLFFPEPLGHLLDQETPDPLDIEQGAHTTGQYHL